MDAARKPLSPKEAASGRCPAVPEQIIHSDCGYVAASALMRVIQSVAVWIDCNPLT